MDEIYQELLRFRKQRERERRIERIKQKLLSYIMPTIEIPEENNEKEDDEGFPDDISEEIQEETEKYDLLDYLLWLLYFTFWITLYIMAIKLQFGMVYLMISALIGICLNTRTRPKKRNEPSAYSVFNKNCEEITGTVNADQYARSMGVRILK